MALAWLQLVCSSGLGPVFGSGEMALQVLAVSLLAGHTLGYSARRKWMEPLLLISVTTGAATLLMRCLPWSYTQRVAAACGWTTLATAALAHLSVRWWNAHPADEREQRFSQFYRSELLGAATALLLGSWLGPWRSTLVLGLPMAAACWSLGAKRWGAALLLIAVIQAAALGGLRQGVWSRLYPGARVVEGTASAYQTVEVIERGGSAELYLNGLCHHNLAQLKLLDALLTDGPLALMGPATPSQPRRALVLGAGGLTSAGACRTRGWDTTVVELDPDVLRLASTWLAAQAGLHPAEDPQLRLVTDDARHFLLQDTGNYDLIVFSLPYPYSLSVASLFTQEFLATLTGRLSSDGILSIYLGAPVVRGRLDPVAASLLLALTSKQQQVILLSSWEAGNSVAWCRPGRGLLPALVRPWSSNLSGQHVRLYSGSSLASLTAAAEPMRLADFRTCARLNWELWRP